MWKSVRDRIPRIGERVIVRTVSGNSVEAVFIRQRVGTEMQNTYIGRRGVAVPAAQWRSAKEVRQ